MEKLDPLKVPAFMRKKNTRRKKKDDAPSAYFRASDVSKPAKPRRKKVEKKVKLPSFTPTPKPQAVTFKADGKPMPIGVVTAYIDKINVAIIKLGTDLEVGARLELIGVDGPFKQPIKSMQLNRKEVQSATRDQEIGIKVLKKVEVGEMVYIIS